MQVGKQGPLMTISIDMGDDTHSSSGWAGTSSEFNWHTHKLKIAGAPV